jgi:tetrahydromethanopterin S-methyltransferase subunit H
MPHITLMVGFPRGQGQYNIAQQWNYLKVKHWKRANQVGQSCSEEAAKITIVPDSA